MPSLQQNFDGKGMVCIIRITKEDAEIIRERFPNVHIRVTCQKAPARKHTYYVEEARKVMTFLAQRRAGIQHD